MSLYSLGEAIKFHEGNPCLEHIYPTSAAKVVTFTPDQATAYWRELAEHNLVYNYGDLEFQYGHPLIIDHQIVKQLMGAADTITKYLIDNIDTPGKLNAWLEGENGISRAPIFCGQKLNIPDINWQLVDHIRKGFIPPFAFDVIASYPEEKSSEIQEKFSFKTVEMQAATGYQGLFKILLDASCKVEPALKDFSQTYGNPLADVLSLKRLTHGKPIRVLDISPMNSRTRADIIYMSQLLGEKDSLPICLSDVFEKDGKWYAYIRDYNNHRTNDVLPIDAVLSRIVPFELQGLEKRFANDPERLNTMLKFLMSSTPQWIYHPSWYQLIDKRDLHKLSEFPETVHYALSTFYSNEIVTKPGLYQVKPVDGVCGLEQRTVKVNDIPIVVANGYMFQQYIPLFGFKAPTYLGDMLSTLEIRVMPPPSCNSNRGTFVMARMAPRRTVVNSVMRATQTNVKQIALAVDYWNNRFQDKVLTAIGKYDKPHRLVPFGFNPVFIK